MKLNLTIILMTLSTVIALGQTTKEVDNELFVTFPTTPEYQANTEATSYVAKSANCLFMSLVLRNQIPNYDQYVMAKRKWTQSEIKKVEDSFLDNAAQGKLDYTGSKGIIKEIQIGKFSGREIKYSAVNPASGERGKRFLTLLLVRDKIIFFECWYLKDNTTSKNQKEFFFNSIKTDK